MKKIVKRKKLLILVAVVMIISVISVISAESGGKITVNNSEICTINGKDVTLAVKPFTFRGEVYLPLDDVMPACGVALGWDGSDSAMVCSTKDDVYKVYLNNATIKVNDAEKVLALYPISYNGTVCIGEKLIKLITDYSVEEKEKIDVEYMEFLFSGGSAEWDCNGKIKKLSKEPFKYGTDVYFSADDVLSDLGYGLGWQDDIRALVCIKNKDVDYIISGKNNIWVNEKQYVFESPSVVDDNKLYISGAMLEKITGGKVYRNGTFKVFYKRDLLDDTAIGDKYRLPGNSVLRGGAITVADGFGMEMLSITNSAASNYAGVVNAVAAACPNVQVFNIAVPTASEFYAPVSMKTSQIDGIRSIYKQLAPNVIPVNVVKPLYEHAGEHIYFKTDHHWTQLGAYYAYREFMKVKGIEMQDISEFENVPGKGFVGSLAGFAGNTAAGNTLRAKPETVDRFIPKYATVGTVYSDMGMKNVLRTVKAVSTTTASYMAFIGGDGPVTAFYTDAPSGETAVIIKESYGNAFATWALNNYKKVYVVDPRKFNGFGGNMPNRFNIKAFCDSVGCTDLILINYPGAISSGGIRQAILDMTK